MIDVILMESEHEGNVGAVCRAMANFGFENLVIVNPKCDLESDDFFRRAKHSKNVIKKIKVVKRLLKYDILIGTTAQISSGYNVDRSVIGISDLLDKVVMLAKVKDISKKKIGLLFGREGDGLTNQELKKCDLITTINSSVDYPTLNLSHAVTIVLYELSNGRNIIKNKKVIEKIEISSEQDRKQLLRLVNNSVVSLEKNKDKQVVLKKIWKNVLGKALLSKREAFGLMGFFRKIENKNKLRKIK